MSCDGRSSWRPLSPRNALQQQAGPGRAAGPPGHCGALQCLESGVLEAEAPPSTELQLWKPPLWHKDWQGNDVKVGPSGRRAALRRVGADSKDSWDHFTMPTCDSGPEPGPMIKAQEEVSCSLR